MPLKCRLQTLGLENRCEYHQLKEWALEGSRIAKSMGRGGGCTHTHGSYHNLSAICLLRVGVKTLKLVQSPHSPPVSVSSTIATDCTLYPWQGPEDVGRYPWHMPGIEQPRISADIPGICHGYPPISRGSYPNPNPNRKQLLSNQKCGLQLEKPACIAMTSSPSSLRNGQN